MLNIVGFILLIVLAIFAYKTAKDYERNAVGWTLISFFTGIGIQIMLPIFIYIVLAVIMTLSGVPAARVQEKIPIVTISVACLLLSVVSGFLIVRHLAKLPEDKTFDAPPAPPANL